MAKLSSSLKNMVLSLLLISAGMSAALSYVYVITKDPITKANKQKEVAAIKDVLPVFDNDPTADVKTIEGLDFYWGTKEGSKVGCAVKTFTEKGFSGKFSIMVGFLPDGTIYKTVVLEQKETPGLGDKMKTKWKDQFNGKDPKSFKLAVKKDGGDVDAITAATISSRGFVDAINKAYVVFMANYCNTPDAMKENLKAVLPEFDNHPATNITTIDSIDVYMATKENKPVGYAVKTFTNKGYNGKIVLLIGFLPDGTIKNIVTLEQKETPGLGGKIQEDPEFMSQFIGQNPAKLKLCVIDDNGDISAMSGATISSRACCDAISKAYTVFKKVAKTPSH